MATISLTRVEMIHNHQYRRPLKTSHILAVACGCCVIILVLMTVCLMSSYWITAEGFRQGLLYLCIEELDVSSAYRSKPLPFNLDNRLDIGCHRNRDKFYIKLSVLLCLVTQLSSLASACLIGFGLLTNNNSKRRFYSLCATSTSLLCLICDLTLIAYYYVEFSNELDESNRRLWLLNRAFGLACGSAVLAFASLCLLLIALHRIAVNLAEDEYEPSRQVATRRVQL